MTSVEQGVLYALSKVSPPRAKPDPEDVDLANDINMRGSDGDDEDDDKDVSRIRVYGRKKPGKRSVAENTFNVTCPVLTFCFSLTSSSVVAKGLPQC